MPSQATKPYRFVKLKFIIYWLRFYWFVFLHQGPAKGIAASNPSATRSAQTKRRETFWAKTISFHQLRQCAPNHDLRYDPPGNATGTFNAPRKCTCASVPSHGGNGWNAGNAGNATRVHIIHCSNSFNRDAPCYSDFGCTSGHDNASSYVGRLRSLLGRY